MIIAVALGTVRVVSFCLSIHLSLHPSVHLSQHVPTAAILNAADLLLWARRAGDIDW